MTVNVFLVVGSFLIVSGLALTAYQVIMLPPPTPAQQSTPTTPQFSVSSPYPGVILAGMGVVLLLATRLFPN